MFARLLLCLAILVSSLYAIRCVNENSILGQNRLQNRLPSQCAHNVFQCSKFECVLSGEKRISKQCDTPSRNPNCEILSKNCVDQGGTPYCYQCDTDMCNGSAPFTEISVVFLFFLGFVGML